MVTTPPPSPSPSTLHSNRFSFIDPASPLPPPLISYPSSSSGYSSSSTSTLVPPPSTQMQMRSPSTPPSPSSPFASAAPTPAVGHHTLVTNVDPTSLQKHCWFTATPTPVFSRAGIWTQGVVMPVRKVVGEGARGRGGSRGAGPRSLRAGSGRGRGECGSSSPRERGGGVMQEMEREEDDVRVVRKLEQLAALDTAAGQRSQLQLGAKSSPPPAISISIPSKTEPLASRSDSDERKGTGSGKDVDRELQRERRVTWIDSDGGIGGDTVMPHPSESVPSPYEQKRPHSRSRTRRLDLSLSVSQAATVTTSAEGTLERGSQIPESRAEPISTSDAVQDDAATVDKVESSRLIPGLDPEAKVESEPSPPSTPTMTSRYDSLLTALQTEAGPSLAFTLGNFAQRASELADTRTPELSTDDSTQLPAPSPPFSHPNFPRSASSGSSTTSTSSATSASSADSVGVASISISSTSDGRYAVSSASSLFLNPLPTNAPRVMHGDPHDADGGKDASAVYTDSMSANGPIAKADLLAAPQPEYSVNVDGTQFQPHLQPLPPPPPPLWRKKLSFKRCLRRSRSRGHKSASGENSLAKRERSTSNVEFPVLKPSASASLAPRRSKSLVATFGRIRRRLLSGTSTGKRSTRTRTRPESETLGLSEGAV